jgi:AcrR family transcriptional regulator
MPRRYRLGERAAQVEATRQRIMDAAIDLYVEIGVSAATMREIGARADVAPGTLRKHFSTRDDLDRAMVGRLTESITLPDLSIFDGARSIDERLERVIAAGAQFIDGAQRLYRMWLREPMLSEPWLETGAAFGDASGVGSTQRRRGRTGGAPGRHPPVVLRQPPRGRAINGRCCCPRGVARRSLVRGARARGSQSRPTAESSTSALSPTSIPAALSIALVTLRASRPPPAGMTFEVNGSPPNVPCTRCCFRPPIFAMSSPGMSATARPLPFVGSQ